MIYGNAYLFQINRNLSLISATIKNIGGNLSDTAEGTITFKIKALESDVFIPIEMELKYILLISL